MRYFVLFMMVLSLSAQENPVDLDVKKELSGFTHEILQDLYDKWPLNREYLDETPTGTKSFTETFYCVHSHNKVTRIKTTAILSKDTIPGYISQVVNWGGFVPVMTTPEFLAQAAPGTEQVGNYIIDVFSLPNAPGVKGNTTYVVTDKQIFKWKGLRETKIPVLEPVLGNELEPATDRFHKIPVVIKPNPVGTGYRFFQVLETGTNRCKNIIMFLGQADSQGSAARVMPRGENKKDIPVKVIVIDSKGDALTLHFAESIVKKDD